jgi:photosystem II stability/assembly factor-like uncharacterized protein
VRGNRRVGVWALAAMAAYVIIGACPAVRAIELTSPNRISDNLYGAAFVNDHDGWVVGTFGVIYRTRDGGKSWHSQVSHTLEPLFSVDFVDTEHGWVVGRSGLVLHTDDGGDTWKAQDSHTKKHLFRVDFVDPDVGCAAGDWGIIVATKDGGKTWEPRPLPRDVILNGLSMVDREHGWIVGEAGTILKTEDGCATWSEQHSGVDKSLFGVYFADRQRGWAVGIDALILHTDDGGATWQLQNGSPRTAGLEQVGFAEAFDHPSLYAVQVVGDRGFAAGEIGAIFDSSDGGKTWSRQKVPQNWAVSWLRDLSLGPGSDGAIVGAGGRRILVTDGRVDVSGENSHASQAAH